jgi:adenosylcobinamide-GDP ribazoletransferase
MDWRAGISLALQGLLPVAGYVYLTHVHWELLVFIPCLVMYLLYLLIWNRLKGYTGDCCGAVCLLVELTVYLVVCAL